MILVIDYGIMKITKSLGIEMCYSMKMSCTQINCMERNMKSVTSHSFEHTFIDILFEDTCVQVIWL
jgi:hypothetical protein